MSFLNPVSEPVKRFSSTDAGAPQINYNARVAGDVKTVLKACLVTGYGAKPSAGWSIANEVDHVAEFVSPSAAMSDYRLGIDDTSNTSTTWYYQYQNARINPSYNAPIKSLTYANKTSNENGWQLFVTERGFIFLELVMHSAINKVSARMTYFGQVKSALNNSVGANMMFFNLGHNGNISSPNLLYDNRYPHLQLNSYTSTQLFSATPFTFAASGYSFGLSNADIISPVYATSVLKDVVLCEVPAILNKAINNAADMYGVVETTIGTRTALSVCCGQANPAESTVLGFARTFLIYLDYWEY